MSADQSALVLKIIVLAGIAIVFLICVFICELQKENKI